MCLVSGVGYTVTAFINGTLGKPHTLQEYSVLREAITEEEEEMSEYFEGQ